MRWSAMAPGGVQLLRRVRDLGSRALFALVILGAVWGATRTGGVPGKYVRDGIDYLLTRHYDFTLVANRVTDYLGGEPGLDVKVMGLPEGENDTEGRLPDLPVTGQVARGFGWQRDKNGWPRFYQGIELKVEDGVPVRAVLSGKVLRVLRDQALGKVIVIEHKQQLASLYGRLGDVGVKVGGDVAQGQMIGTVAGNYLHFELRRGDQLVDPLLELQHKQ